ncbi:MAG: hypothetical protein A2284_03255 [Deltaproteobacteria bacterium RIFOXYA12_FULL_61_11]|nr:MAG: hypothetical protein A2284_03255 [Deltaproteobacteria bacterium RIFOXYA12_FULL_61_11]
MRDVLLVLLFALAAVAADLHCTNTLLLRRAEDPGEQDPSDSLRARRRLCVQDAWFSPLDADRRAAWCGPFSENSVPGPISTGQPARRPDRTAGLFLAAHILLALGALCGAVLRVDRRRILLVTVLFSTLYLHLWMV